MCDSFKDALLSQNSFWFRLRLCSVLRVERARLTKWFAYTVVCLSFTEVAKSPNWQDLADIDNKISKLGFGKYITLRPKIDLDSQDIESKGTHAENPQLNSPATYFKFRIRQGLLIQ